MVPLEIVSLANLALMAVILSRAVRTGLWRQFRVFHGYLLYEALCTVAGTALIATHGVASPSYRFFYYAAMGGTPLLQAWVLMDGIGRMVQKAEEGPKIARRILLFAIILVVPVAATRSGQNLDLFQGIQGIALVFQMSLCLLVYSYLAERPQLHVGANLGGILGGSALLTGCQSLNFFGYFNARIPFAAFQILVPSIYFAALVIFAVSLWNVAPAQLVTETRQLNVHLKQSLKLVLRSLILK